MSLGTIKRTENGFGPDFRKKKPAVNGILSIIVGTAAIGAFVFAGYISSKASGAGDERVGYLGIVSAILCILGDVLAGAGFGEKEVSYVLPYIGLGVNSAMLVYLLYLVLYGLL